MRSQRARACESCHRPNSMPGVQACRRLDHRAVAHHSGRMHAHGEAAHLSMMEQVSKPRWGWSGKPALAWSAGIFSSSCMAGQHVWGRGASQGEGCKTVHLHLHCRRGAPAAGLPECARRPAAGGAAPMAAQHEHSAAQRDHSTRPGRRTSMRKGSRFFRAGVPRVLQMRTPAPSCGSEGQQSTI